MKIGINADMMEKMEAWKTNALLVVHYKNLSMEIEANAPKPAVT